MRNFIECTCGDGDRLAIAVDQIRSFIEYTSRIERHPGCHTKITYVSIPSVESSGNPAGGSTYSYVRETYDQIREKVIAAQGGEEAVS